MRISSSGAIQASVVVLLLLLLLVGLTGEAMAHTIAAGDRSFVEQNSGFSLAPFMYLGAKHMITGIDHILYLAGVIFFLRRARDVAIFVSLFTLGHSVTLLSGVLAGWQVNSYLVDTAIGLSIVYKALENLCGLSKTSKFWPDPRAAVLVFGLAHGLGLSTKLQDLTIGTEGIVANMIAFNVGVELGQLIALAFLLIVFAYLRGMDKFERFAATGNVLLMTAGLTLMGYQFTGYILLG